MIFDSISNMYTVCFFYCMIYSKNVCNRLDAKERYRIGDYYENTDYFYRGNDRKPEGKQWKDSTTKGNALPFAGRIQAVWGGY